VHIVAYILGTKLAYIIDVPDTACSKAAICANGIASRYRKVWLKSVPRRKLKAKCTYQEPVSNSADPPRADSLRDSEQRSDHISDGVFQVKLIQALFVRARKTFGWRPSPLYHANCSKHVVLRISELLSIFTGTWVDWIAALVVQLDVVVAIEILVSSGELGLGRTELDIFIGLVDASRGLEC
jgi:hypothetical protein